MDHRRRLREHHRGVLGSPDGRLPLRHAPPAFLRGMIAVSVTVRGATADDARAIAEVHVASWRWAYRGQVPGEILESLSVDEREAMWTGSIHEGKCRTAVAVDAAGAVVGFIATGPSADDDAVERTGEVYAIYLLEDAAGAGIGTALLRRGVDDLRSDGYRRSTLWVL